MGYKGLPLSLNFTSLLHIDLPHINVFFYLAHKNKMAKNQEELLKYLREAIDALEKIRDDDKNNDNKWKTFQPRKSQPLIIPNRLVS